ncbi:MAG: hypothetical protein H8M99_15690 [Gloeobacteraceae cyanobacterium ES-bin-144]|nr:hypothetical protein [Verrucomicrobiales bacterium]
MRQLLVSFCALTCWPLHAGVEVTFPVATKPEGITKSEIVRGLTADVSPEPIRIDGLIAFYSGAQYYGGESRNPESFDKLKEGMTLREIVSLLGPGSQNKFEGIGLICWRCEDGRVLQVWPTDKLNEKARYHIALHGTAQRREDVVRLAKALVSGANVANQKVAVTLTEDTHQAKAGQLMTYEVGQTFQRVEPLPRIDFTITKIKGNSVYCRYFYQAPPEGLLRYTESGDLILNNREQD